MNYWLIKSEPMTYSIDDLKKDGRTAWDGVRNYQHHSNAESPGVAGVCRLVLR